MSIVTYLVIALVYAVLDTVIAGMQDQDFEPGWTIFVSLIWPIAIIFDLLQLVHWLARGK